MRRTQPQRWDWKHDWPPGGLPKASDTREPRISGILPYESGLWVSSVPQQLPLSSLLFILLRNLLTDTPSPYLALRRRGEGVVGVPALCQPREGLADLRLMDTAPKRGGTCSEQNPLGAPCKLAWSVSRILRMWSRLA